MGKRKSKDNNVMKNKEIIVKKSCSKTTEIAKVEPEEGSNGEAIIEILSDDNLAKIFSYLPIKKRLDMEKVSFRWRDVSQQSWHDIKELDFTNSINNELLVSLKKQTDIEKILERCGYYLTYLNLSKLCNSSILQIIREHCNNLERIELDLCKYSDTHFINAFTNMDKLKYIKIKNTYGQYLFRCLTSLSDEIEEIHLGILSSKNCPGYLYNPLPKNSLNRFNSLRCLSINSHEIDHNEIKIISQKSTIVNLNLAFCKLNKDYICLLSDLVNLKYLDLRGVDAVFDIFLKSITWQCVSLKYLDISLCTSVSDIGLNELSKLNYLDELYVNDMRRNITDYPFEHFRQLKILHCRNCKYIGDAGIIELIKNSNNLEILDITRTSVTSETLFSASSTTKIRNNNIILQITVDSWLLDDFDVNENTSEYLIIKKV